MKVFVLMKREEYEYRVGSIFSNEETIKDEILKLQAIYPYEKYYYEIRELDPKPLETNMEKGLVYSVMVEVETGKIIDKHAEEKYRLKDVTSTEWILPFTNNRPDCVKVVSPISYEHAIEQAEKEVERMRTK